MDTITAPTPTAPEPPGKSVRLQPRTRARPLEGRRLSSAAWVPRSICATVSPVEPLALASGRDRPQGNGRRKSSRALPGLTTSSWSNLESDRAPPTALLRHRDRIAYVPLPRPAPTVSGSPLPTAQGVTPKASRTAPVLLERRRADRLNRHVLSDRNSFVRMSAPFA